MQRFRHHMRVIPGDRRETRDTCLSVSGKVSGMDPGSAPLARLVRDDSRSLTLRARYFPASAAS